jgi:hypothetical protein
VIAALDERADELELLGRAPDDDAATSPAA